MRVSLDSDRFRSRVREFRVARGMSQQALALRAGLSRQSVNTIEGQRSMPSVEVALRLARALECRVEDLFAFDPPRVEEAVHVARGGGGASGRVALAKVRGRVIAHPLSAQRGLQEGFVSADGLLAPGRAGRARLLEAPEDLDRTALLLGCDPSLGILCAHVARRSPSTRLVWLSASSTDALTALAGGEAHAAGSHLQGPQGEVDNVTPARRALGAAGGTVVAFARWEQGFVVAPGNPKGVRSAADLARPGLRLVNREPGSGARSLLDRLLLQAGLPAGALPGYDRTVGSHLDVARSVASGGADAGIALRAVAEAYGLDFVPLAEVRFDLVIPHDLLEHAAISAMLDVLCSGAFREELAALPGYGVSQTGDVIADLAAVA